MGVDRLRQNLGSPLTGRTPTPPWTLRRLTLVCDVGVWGLDIGVWKFGGWGVGYGVWSQLSV